MARTKEQNREYMQRYMAAKRAAKGVNKSSVNPKAEDVNSGSVNPKNVNPKMLTPVRPELDRRGRGMTYVGDCKPCQRCDAEYGHWTGYCDQPEAVTVKRPEPANPNNLPIYNCRVHRAGDRVLLQRNFVWGEYTVPVLDSEGRLIT